MSLVNFITTTLPPKFGGRTKSLLERANILNDEGIPVRIVTTNYNEDYETIYGEYYKSKKVTTLTSFVNVYDFYKDTYTSKVPISWDDFLEKLLGKTISSLNRVQLESQPDRVRLYHQGLPKVIIRYRDDGSIYNFALYEIGFRKPNIFYMVNRQGFVHRISYVTEGYQYKEQYLLNDGTVYCERHFNSTGAVILTKLLQDGAYKEFKKMKSFFTFFYEELFTKDDIVVSDARLLDLSLLSVNVKKKIFQMHGSHLEDPTGASMKIKKSFKTLLTSQKLTKEDVIVSLTPEQRDDILKVQPELVDNIVVIPHSTKPRNIEYTRNENHFLIVSRLHEGKNIQDSIRAFSIFSQNNPNYVLDIFGDGAEKDNLENLIINLNMQNKVILHGRTDDVDQQYQKSVASLFTSEYEGFGLSVLESISNGTPVLAYPVKYGPKDIIGTTAGRVIDEKSPEKLAEEMSAFVKDFSVKEDDIIKQSKKFSQEEFTKKWLRILKS